MDIIWEFESKLKIIGWEKVYSARELMKIFGYNKWERFLWAINRAKEDLMDEKKIEENFLIVIDKETWGRPKEDVLLTLWACYLVLKKCDERKENVKILLNYLDDILQEKKQKKVTFSFQYEIWFWFLVSCFIVLSVLFYLKNYTTFLYPDINNIGKDMLTKKEFIHQIEKQEEVFQEFDNMLFLPEENQEVSEKSSQIWYEDIFESEFREYLDTMSFFWNLKQQDEKKYINFHSDFNQRTLFTQKLSWEDLIKSYFLFWNQKAYKDSCSLLSKKFCLSGAKWSFADFWNYWEKTKDGYFIQEVKEVVGEKEKNIYCVSYSYKLKNDTSNEYITETFNFTTQKNGEYEQIVGRFCEKIEKAGKNIKCPFELNNYYCN